MNRAKISLVLLLALLIEVQSSKASAGILEFCYAGLNNLSEVIGFGRAEVATSSGMTLDPDMASEIGRPEVAAPAVDTSDAVATNILQANPAYAVFSPELERFFGEGGTWRPRTVYHFQYDEHGNTIREGGFKVVEYKDENGVVHKRVVLISTGNSSIAEEENGMSVSFQDGRDFEFDFATVGEGDQALPVLGITFTHSRNVDYAAKFEDTRRKVQKNFGSTLNFRVGYQSSPISTTLFLYPDSQGANTMFLNLFYSGIRSFKSYRKKRKLQPRGKFNLLGVRDNPMVRGIRRVARTRLEPIPLD